MSSEKAEKPPAPAESLATKKVNLRCLMTESEVKLILDNEAAVLASIKKECGARVFFNVEPEQEKIINVKGVTKQVTKGFEMLCHTFEKELMKNTDVPKPLVTIRLILPAYQCGSLIGKSGTKIKDIRESTNSSITVASDLLPNSTERTVTVVGTTEAIASSVEQICEVILECASKGTNIQYRTKPQVDGPVILCGDKAYCIQGDLAIPAHPNMFVLGNSPLDVLSALGVGGLGGSVGAINPAALAAIAGSKLTSNTSSSQGSGSTQNTFQEFTVPNELLGCIIGKGGSKITEIRQVSGAMIRISNCQNQQVNNTDRTVSISGNPDAVSLAHFLINMSIELQKANLQSQKNHNQSGGSGPKKPFQLDNVFNKLISSFSNYDGDEGEGGEGEMGEEEEEDEEGGFPQQQQGRQQMEYSPRGRGGDRRFN